MELRFVMVGMLVACSGGQSNTSGQPRAGGSSAKPVLAAGCPAAFGATGGCDAPARCDYAEGSCVCRSEPICSGVDWGDERPTPPPTWSCTPNVRADGCPGAATAGEPCEGTRECGYGSCGGVVLGCVNGHWKVVRTIDPPA